MAHFPITYELGWQYGPGFAEVEGRALVDADGEVRVELLNLTNEYTTLTPADNELAVTWLRADPHYRETLAEAESDAVAGAKTYAREIARS